jgi:hypothetical protein
MAKRVDALKAKQAKQRKIAIGLSVALVLVLAYQGPKTLKMLKGPAPVAVDATAAPAATTPAAPAATGVVPPAAGDPAVAAAQPAVLADSDTPIGAGAGQLLSFERFESSDPFKQQVEVDASAAIDPTADDNAAPGTAPTDAAVPGSAENPPISFGGGASTTAGSTGSSGAVPGATAPAPAAATTISVNGVVSTVTAGTEFPADNPTFKLVSVAKDGKSVRIGVAGGNLAGGGATVKLVLNKSLTLQNTADGSRYKLVLLTVEGATPPTG